MALQLEWNDDEVEAALSASTMDGLELAGEHLLGVSSPLAPHEEGELERSGDTDRDEDALQVSVFFDRPYAVRQHEDLTLRHDEGRQAKYLEQPMHEEADVMLAIVAKAAGAPLEP